MLRDMEVGISYRDLIGILVINWGEEGYINLPSLPLLSTSTIPKTIASKQGSTHKHEERPNRRQAAGWEIYGWLASYPLRVAEGEQERASEELEERGARLDLV
jgi:hypothetical protein